MWWVHQHVLSWHCMWRMMFYSFTTCVERILWFYFVCKYIFPILTKEVIVDWEPTALSFVIPYRTLHFFVPERSSGDRNLEFSSESCWEQGHLPPHSVWAYGSLFLIMRKCQISSSRYLTCTSIWTKWTGNWWMNQYVIDHCCQFYLVSCIQF